MMKDYELTREVLEALTTTYAGVRISRQTKGRFDKTVVSGSNIESKMQSMFMEETGGEVEPVNCFIGSDTIKAVLETSGETLMLSFDEDGSFTLNGITFEEEEAPDADFDNSAFMRGVEKLYSGDRAAVEEHFLPLAKKHSDLFGEEVEEYRTDLGKMIVGANGFAIFELKKENPLPEAEQVTPDVAALFDDEVPFEEVPKATAEEPVKEAESEEPTPDAKPAKAEKADKPKAEAVSDEEPERTVRLLKAETFACVVGTKTLSAAISKITAAVGNKVLGPISLAAKGKAIGLIAYAEPVQVMTTVALKAAAFAEGDVATTFYLNLERLSTMVRSLESVEEELRISLKGAKVMVKGEETSFTLDTTKEGQYLTDKPDGLRAEFDTESLVKALNASCFYDEKATNNMAKAVYLTVSNGKPVMYSLDGHMASRAFFKGSFSEECGETFALPPCVTKFKLVGADKVRMWFGEKMFWIQCNQTLYTVRYLEGNLPKTIENFFGTDNSLTTITVQAGEMKSRVALVDGIAGSVPEAAVKGSVVNLNVGKTIKVQSGEQAATVAALAKHEGTADVSFNAKLLMKVFGVFDGGSKVKMHIKDRGSVAEDKDISVLLLGVRKTV